MNGARAGAPDEPGEPGDAGGWLSGVYAYAVWIALLGIVVMPGIRNQPEHRYDSFPWSSYPMFAHSRKTSKTVVHHAVGYTEDGERRRLPPRLVANDEVLQAAATIRNEIRRGGRRSRALCRRIARNTAASPAYDEVVRVEIVTDHYDCIEYFAGDIAPKRSKVHASCPVLRGGPGS